MEQTEQKTYQRWFLLLRIYMSSTPSILICIPTLNDAAGEIEMATGLIRSFAMAIAKNKTCVLI